SQDLYAILTCRETTLQRCSQMVVTSTPSRKNSGATRPADTLTIYLQALAGVLRLRWLHPKMVVVADLQTLAGVPRWRWPHVTKH
ncbi:Hypothetical predicted protein, partial [Marmota monax]